MKLASEASVFEALQVGSISLIELAATSALHAATEEIAAMLLADFDAGSYVEDFFIHATTRAGSCYQAQLALGHGFVTGTPALVTASTFADLATGDTLASTEYKIDAEKGGINIISTVDLQGYYVRVTYSAGFEIDDVDDELFASVPQWLQLIATKVGCAALIEMAPDLAGSAQGEAGRKPEEIRKAAYRMAEKKMRYFPSPIRPI